MAMRTSETDPIRISWLAPGMGWGRIGMTLCPGKRQIAAASGAWDRDMETDLRDIRNWGAQHIISLLSDSEIAELAVQNLGDLSLAIGLQWHQLRVNDGGVPDGIAEKNWKQVSRELLEAISNGENILFHCKGGQGRTGMFAARFLAENGLEPYLAIGKVREARSGAIENHAQEQNVHNSARSTGPFVGGIADIGNWSRDSPPSLLDRFRGSLLGGAVGDALGAAVEFHSYQDIKRIHGPGGIKNFAPVYGRLGAITDDTQMTMFTTEGCIRSFTRFLDRGLSSPKDVIRRAYQRWLATQGPFTPAEPGSVDLSPLNGWLIEVKDLHSPRSPGNTCLNGLISRKPVRESKCCGGVMRTAPIGLFGATGVFKGSVFELGCDAAGITHGHPTGYIAGGALAQLIDGVVQGQPLKTACQRLLTDLVAIDGAVEVQFALKSAVRLAEEQGSDEEAISDLGEGWVAEEALAIGIYAALVSESVEDAVVLAVNHSGDSDSTGSIAGQIKGAQLGINSIPDSWLNGLELRQEINRLATDLHSLCYYGRGSASPAQFDEKYPPN